jgi:hypothetical protein
MFGLRKEQTFAGSAFADAEKARICVVTHLALPHLSPKRPFVAGFWMPTLFCLSSSLKTLCCAD